MGMTTTVRIDDEVDVDIDDDDIVEYVCNDPELVDRVLDAHHMDADQWAKRFWESDAVAQEHMMAALRRVCPTITITFAK